MKCPHCDTENRDERDACYHCQKDLSMLRLIVNKAKHHYNLALEHAERGRNDEAIIELKNAIDLDSRNASAYVVLGTVYARLERFDEARDAWRRALAVDPTLEKASDYLAKSETYIRALPALRFYRIVAAVALGLILASGIWMGYRWISSTSPARFNDAVAAYKAQDWGRAREILEKILTNPKADPNLLTSAEIMRSVIGDQIGSRYQAVQAAAKTRDYAAGREAIAYLRDRKVGQDLEIELTGLEERLLESARAEIDQLLAQYSEGGFNFGRLAAALDRIESAWPDGAPGIDLVAARRQIETSRSPFENDRLAQIRSDWVRSHNDEAAAVSLYALLQLPGQHTEARQMFADVAGRIRGRIESETAPRLAKGRYEEAIRIEDEALADLPEGVRGAIFEGSKSTGALVREARARRTLAGLDALASQENWEEFLRKTSELDRGSLSPGQAADVETTKSLALKAQARAFMNYCQDTLDARFDSPPGKGVKSKDALKLLDLWDRIEPQIPARDGYARRQFEFYRAAAAFVVGRTEDSSRWFGQFLDKYGGIGSDDYLRSAERYLELLKDAPASKPPAP